jgi:hypothetical protein
MNVNKHKTSMTQEHIYCTYFDSGYLSRALTLFESMAKHGDTSRIVVLALDKRVENFFASRSFENVEVITLATLEAREPRLLVLKESRSTMEYYFTCTPLLIEYALERVANSKDAVSIYLDADLYFFDDPVFVLDQMKGFDVGIIEHRYPEKLASKLAKYGRFNVGWVAFRNTKEGHNVLSWYSEQTLEWCSDIPEDGKYADQGYLDWFPEFNKVKIITHPGVNLAPWNTSRHTLSIKQDKTYSDGQRLQFFHFHGVRKVGNRFTTSQLIYRSPMNKILRNWIYQPYIDRLNHFDKMVLDCIGPNLNIKKRGNGIIGFLSRVRKKTFDVMSIILGNSLKPH